MKTIKISDEAYEYLSQEKGNFSFAQILDKLLFDKGEMKEIAYKSDILEEEDVRNIAESVVEDKIEEMKYR